MRKKWLAALLAAVLVLSGCGSRAESGSAGDSAVSAAPAGSAASASAGSGDGAGSEAPELTEEDIQAAEAAARDYYAGTVFTVEGMAAPGQPSLRGGGVQLHRDRPQGRRGAGGPPDPAGPDRDRLDRGQRGVLRRNGWSFGTPMMRISAGWRA